MESDTSVAALSVVIADDEPVARARLRRLLSEESGVTIVAECANGQETVAAVLAQRPDLVFLDIEMPELNGFEVLESLPSDAVPAFVFVTAFDEYALKAFAVDALDYLLKPFDGSRLQVTLDRARQRLRTPTGQAQIVSAIRELTNAQREIRRMMSRRGDEAAPLRDAYIDRIAVKADGRVHFVRVDEIDFVESAANYVRLHVGTTSHLVRETLRDLGARLDPARFPRIHRSTIVNLDRVKEIQPWFSGDAVVILKNGKRLRLSRVFRASFESATGTRL